MLLNHSSLGSDGSTPKYTTVLFSWPEQKSAACTPKWMWTHRSKSEYNWFRCGWMNIAIGTDVCIWSFAAVKSSTSKIAFNSAMARHSSKNYFPIAACAESIRRAAAKCNTTQYVIKFTRFSQVANAFVWELYWNFLELNFSLLNYFVCIKFGVKSMVVALRSTKVRCTLFCKNFSLMFGISANIFVLLVASKLDASADIPDSIHFIEGWSCSDSQILTDSINLIIIYCWRWWKNENIFLIFIHRLYTCFLAHASPGISVDDVQCVAFGLIEYVEEKKFNAIPCSTSESFPFNL